MKKKSLAIVTAAILAISPVAASFSVCHPAIVRASSSHLYKVKIEGRKGQYIPTYKANGKKTNFYLVGQRWFIFTNFWKRVPHHGRCIKLAGSNNWMQIKYLPKGSYKF